MFPCEFELMQYSEIILKMRADTNKVYLLLPKTGKMLEFKSKFGISQLYQLLQLMKPASGQEIESLSDMNKRKQIQGAASEALDIYEDLKLLEIDFKGTKEAGDLLKAHILGTNHA